MSSTQKHMEFTAVGPETPAGKFLRSFWQPIHQSARLPAGKAVPLRILGEEFTLFRGESGAAHHRGRSYRWTGG